MLFRELLTAFGGGVLSFTSPCILPLIPAYLSYTTGYSIQDLRDKNTSTKVSLTRALSFVAGFSLVFTLLGTATGALGDALIRYRMVIARVSGVVLIVFALQIAHILNIGFLNKSKTVNIKHGNRGVVQAFYLGVAFAVGWTPCVGSILASILLITTTTSSIQGALMLFVYSLGIGVPFILFSIFTQKALKLTKHANYKLIETLSALLVFLAGVYLIINGRF